MRSKLCCICSIILLSTNTFGMKHFERGYNYGQQRPYFRKLYKRGNNCRYDHNKRSYASQERTNTPKYYKGNCNNLDCDKKIFKKRKTSDKESQGIDALIENYNYYDALNFFQKVQTSEDYPIKTWNDNDLDWHSKKIDFGTFDQRQEFIDMFKPSNNKCVNNCIIVDFSYGQLKHDMFIEQSEKGHKYSTDRFLFQNNVNFNKRQASDAISSYLKPYLSKEDLTGILTKFIQHPDKIQNFAINVLRIMKLSSKGILPIKFDIDRVMTFESFEIAGMILSTERLRSEKSLLLSYIEFYKLKHTKNRLFMLQNMFDKYEPILKFPASPGGIQNIQKTDYRYIYKRFLDMIKYSPEYTVLQQCDNVETRRQLADKFFQGKLEKIKALLENRQPKFKSKFKSAIRNYKLNNPPIKPIYTNGSINKGNSITKISSKQNDQTTEDISDDEYFNNFSNFSDSDYDAIFDNTIASA